MAKKGLSYTQNRELSWLEFNKRVLEEARDKTVPLLERMKFVAIFTSNLDEFFMIRVGSLCDLAAVDSKTTDSRSGMTAQEQVDKILEMTAPLYRERDKTYADIRKQLRPYGICGLEYKELEAPEKKYVKKYFKSQILPVLSPQIVDASHPFPHLENKQLYVIATLSHEGHEGKGMLGIVPVPRFISNILYLPGTDIRYICMEKVLLEYLDTIFEGYEIQNKNCICVTRNADVTPDEEDYTEHEDFRNVMQKALKKRRRMAVMRLEVAHALDKETEKYFCEKFQIEPKNIFHTKTPMKLDHIFSVVEKLPESMRKALIYSPFEPQPAAMVAPGSIMQQIAKKDILLSYPYESMEPFLRLLKEASEDPNVMLIKITIYRLAKQARLVEYLCQAAENGKEVTVLIELRARFDEQNNIEWSKRLEEAGCRVIYGSEGYKVHSKICLVAYRNRNEIRYITQVGTGNYNEKTAKMYTDVCLMTADQSIGEEAVEFFKNMAIGNLEGEYHRLLVSPVSLKKTVLSMIDEEIQKGREGRIVMKMNSVTDLDFIRKIAEASKAGAQIDLIVRGICCILPGIPGETENLTVTSIVGRYLEHARIFSFGKGVQQKIYIGSADMMTRNTEKRVEVACPIYSEEIKQKLTHMLDVMLSDNVKARTLISDGTFVKKAASSQKVIAQEIFMEEAICAERPVVRKKKSILPAWLRKAFEKE